MRVKNQHGGADKHGTTVHTSPWTRSTFHLAVVAAFGVTASVVMFWVVEHLERSRAEAYFHQVAEQRLSVVRSNVAGALDTISLLASHFEATGEAGTSRQAFSTLVAPALAKHRYIQALEWIPRVEGAARPDYERLARCGEPRRGSGLVGGGRCTSPLRRASSQWGPPSARNPRAV